MNDEERQRRRDEHHRENMARYGWYANYVSDHPESPTGFSTHTYGLDESWHHPNIQIVVPMPPKLGHSLLIQMAEMVAAGRKFEAGIKYDDVLEDLPVMFAWADESGRRVLRAILPDKEGGVERGKIKAPYSEQWEGTEE